jgi:hypothetical protein
VYRSSPKKKPTRTNRVGRIQLELRIRLTVEHNSSNTGDPLSTGPLSAFAEATGDRRSLDGGGSSVEGGHNHKGLAIRLAQSAQYTMKKSFTTEDADDTEDLFP